MWKKAGFDIRSFQEEYLLTLSISYFEFLKARKGLEIANSNVERLTKYRDAARTRLKAGEITKTTVLRAEGELSGALSDQIKARNVYESARVYLARLVGIERDFQIREIPVAEWDGADLEVLKEKALKNRPDVKSTEMQVQMAEKQIDVTRGAYWPSLSVAGVYSATDQSPETASYNKESVYGAVTLNFPMFEGGLRRAEVRESESRYRQAEFQYRDFVKSVNVEVENTYLDLIAQKGIYKSAQDQLAYAEDNIRAIAKQFEFGLASSLDVIDANNLLISAQKLMADATYNYQFFILRMQRVTGSPLMELTRSEDGGTHPRSSRRNRIECPGDRCTVPTHAIIRAVAAAFVLLPVLLIGACGKNETKGPRRKQSTFRSRPWRQNP